MYWSYYDTVYEYPGIVEEYRLQNAIEFICKCVIVRVFDTRKSIGRITCASSATPTRPWARVRSSWLQCQAWLTPGKLGPNHKGAKPSPTNRCVWPRRGSLAELHVSHYSHNGIHAAGSGADQT